LEKCTLKKVKVSYDYLALFVAVLVLFLTVWEGYETRQHNRISVVPKLNLDIKVQSSNNNKSISYHVESTGLGPVKVVDFAVLYNHNGKVVQSNDFNYLVTDLHGMNEKLKINLDLASSNIDVGSFISPGEQEVLFKASGKSKTEVPDVINKHVRDTLDIVICYCSVYDDQCGQAQFTNPPVIKYQCKSH